MKRFLIIFGVGFFICLSLLAASVAYFAFRVPPTAPLPLPDSLVGLHSKIGQEMLTNSRFMADYESLYKNFVSQSRTAYCAVASSVIILNAMQNGEHRFTQSSVFSNRARKVTGPLAVSFSGMTLAKLRDFFRAHDQETTLFYASESDLNTFRSTAKINLKTQGDFLLVNYQRTKLEQEGFGHFSPIAAYHAETDRLLILDVAAHKYPPVWVSTETLWKAMNTVVSLSGKTRGFIVVRDRSAQISPKISKKKDYDRRALRDNLQINGVS